MSAAARVLRWAGGTCILIGVVSWVFQPWLLAVILPWAERHLSSDHVVTAHGRLLLRLALAFIGTCAAAAGAVLWIYGRRGDANGLVRLFADETRRPGGTSYRTFVVACGLAVVSIAAFLVWRDQPWFSGEDRALEDAQLLAAAVAAIFFARAAARLPRRSWPRWIQAMLALGCGLLVLEELSWGQRLFGWSTPATWASLNEQGETNLHNLVDNSFASHLAGIGALALAALAGILLRSRQGTQGLYSWLLPPAGLLPLVVAIVAIEALHPRGTLGTGWDEIQELLGTLLLAFFAAASRARSQKLG